MAYAVAQLMQQGPLARLAPGRFGCAVQVVSGRTGRNLANHAQPAVILQRGNLSAIIWPQATVRVPGGHLRIDLLVIAALAGRRRTLAIELYSDTTHPDRQKDLDRARRLPIPLARLHVTAITRALAVDALLAWITSRAGVPACQLQTDSQ